MKGKLGNGRTFEMSPDWLKNWELENGSTYYSCSCGWRGTRPRKTERLVNYSGGVGYKKELRCPDCGEIIQEVK